jgi:DnaD/phage-associated family protein
MAEFRQIHTRIWKDDWFSELDLDAKLLFVYLFSNEQAEVGGVYELPIKYMSFEAGIPQERISKLLTYFEDAKKVYYRNGWVWVVNLRKYNESRSEKVAIRIKKDLASLPDGELKKMYCEYYKIPYRYPIDTLSIPVCEKKNGIDTLPILIRTETDTERETETDTDDSAEVFSAYQNNIGAVTKITMDKLDGDILDFTPEWVTAAIGEAVRHEKRSLAYVEGILKGWKRDGFRNDTRSNGNGSHATINADGTIG